MDAEPLKFEPMTDEQFAIFAEVVADPWAAVAKLPEEEQAKYRESLESIVAARRAGERLAREMWVS